CGSPSMERITLAPPGRSSSSARSTRAGGGTRRFIDAFLRRPGETMLHPRTILANTFRRTDRIHPVCVLRRHRAVHERFDGSSLRWDVRNEGTSSVEEAEPSLSG